MPLWLKRERSVSGKRPTDFQEGWALFCSATLSQALLARSSLNLYIESTLEVVWQRQMAHGS